MIKRYTYRPSKKEDVLFSRKPVVAAEIEQLFGIVQGADASDIEERFARALDKKNKEYIFRVPLGQRGELGFTHRGQQTQDQFKDAFVMEYFKEYNPFPVKRIPGEKLATQEIAD